MAAIETFRVGSSKVDITPPLSVPYLAWKPRHRPFRGVHDRLLARAAVIEAGGERVVIIAADLIGFADKVLGPGRSFIDEIRQRVEKTCGVRAAHVMLAASHAHSTPDTLDFRPLRDEPGALAWLEELVERIAQCAATAASDTFAATLSSAETRVPGVSVNRRDGARAVNDTLTKLTFCSLHDARCVAIVHFACHPVIVQVQDQVSSDFVGVLTAAIEASGVENCLFLQGASADINPSCGDSRDFADVRRIGETIARCALAAEHTSAEPARVQVLHAPPLQAMRIGHRTLIAFPSEMFDVTSLELSGAIVVGCANGYLGYFVPTDEWPKGGYEVGPGEWQIAGAGAHEMAIEAAMRLIEGLDKRFTPVGPPKPLPNH